MPTEVIIGLLSLLGTAIGTLGGIVASSRLTAYKIEQLTRHVEKHNSFAEKIPLLEEKIKVLNHRVEDLERR